MGVDVSDFDGDGDEDIFITHLRRQTNTIYVNEGGGWFSDQTLATGLGASSFPYTSFGTAWVDYDNDGLLDLLIANGAVQTIEALALANDPYPLHQPNQLFRNVGGGKFEEASSEAGPAFEMSEVTRGAAFDLAEYNVQVNAIAPGAVPVPNDPPPAEDSDLYKAWMQYTPCARFGTPEDVAAGALYLASSDSDWVTGQVLSIDGGITAGPLMPSFKHHGPKPKM